MGTLPGLDSVFEILLNELQDGGSRSKRVYERMLVADVTCSRHGRHVAHAVALCMQYTFGLDVSMNSSNLLARLASCCWRHSCGSVTLDRF